MKGKVIVIAGVLMGILAGALVLVLVSQSKTTSAAEPTPEPPAVVRAAQNIAKGDEVQLEAVQLVRLNPGEPVPPDAVKDPMKVAGMSAAMDIPQGTIIQQAMLYDREALAEFGRNASKLFQPGRVAVAFPVGDVAGVGGALRAGDRIDVLASFELVNVDPASQTRLPADGKVTQEPRTVVQMALQDIEILRVGPWAASADASGGQERVGPVTTNLVTLLASPQDALVLRFLLEKMDEGQARVAFALRSEDDRESAVTEAVTLDYVMRRFNIPVPPKLDITTDQIRVKGDLGVR